MDIKTTQQVGKALDRLFKKYNIEKVITVEEVKKWIWNATGEGMEAVNKFNKKCLNLFPEAESIDELNDILQVFVDAWNHFPHKALEGKAPVQIMCEEMKKLPKGEKTVEKPKIIVGNREMEWDEFENMLNEMEKAQKPFKKWIDKDLLPKYKKYLEQIMKGKRSQEDHHQIAELFFQRVLHVGFVNLGSIRPEFIWEEFPRWWPTHVLQSNLKPAQVRKSLERLFAFIDVIYMD